MENKIIVVLDNLRSTHNVGSIFRTADGAGVEKIYLLGTTPAPIDRFGREVPEIKKTSLGASEFVSWEHLDNEATSALAAKLKADGFKIVAVEQTPQSVSIHEFIPADKVVCVFGNEVDGVGKEWLEVADSIVEIPMQGQKESLNVSVTAGVVLFKTANVLPFRAVHRY